MREVRVVEGQLVGRGLKFALIASRFNEPVVAHLIAGAVDCLIRHGVGRDDLRVVRVPGAFEIPLASRAVIEAGGVDALICLGALIRGATPHFDLLASQVTAALSQLQLSSGIPIAFGLLACDSVEQAMDRAGLKSGNKGAEAALAAIESANLLKELKSESGLSMRRGRS